jgi:hypothetical protein
MPLAASNVWSFTIAALSHSSGRSLCSPEYGPSEPVRIATNKNKTQLQPKGNKNKNNHLEPASSVAGSFPLPSYSSTFVGEHQPLRLLR